MLIIAIRLLWSMTSAALHDVYCLYSSSQVILKLSQSARGHDAYWSWQTSNYWSDTSDLTALVMQLLSCSFFQRSETLRTKNFIALNKYYFACVTGLVSPVFSRWLKTCFRIKGYYSYYLGCFCKLLTLFDIIASLVDALFQAINTISVIFLLIRHELQKLQFMT